MMNTPISLYTRINGKRVGTGKWSFKSILSYCEQVGITLKTIHYIDYSHHDGLITTTLNIDTGEIIEVKKMGT